MTKYSKNINLIQNIYYKETYLSAYMFCRLSQKEIFTKLTYSLKKVTVQSYQDPEQNLVRWMFDDFLQSPSPRKILHYKEGHFILSGGGTSLMTINNGCSLIRLELVELLIRIIAFFKLFFKHNIKCLNCLSILMVYIWSIFQFERKKWNYFGFLLLE